jgi:DNA-binding response OmpR family regulator
LACSHCARGHARFTHGRRTRLSPGPDTVEGVRFGVLGPLAVWTDDGREVQVPEAKVRRLLADLLVHEGQPVSADRLVDDLWGDRPPGNPLNTLQTKISQLRRALGGWSPTNAAPTSCRWISTRRGFVS